MWGTKINGSTNQLMKKLRLGITNSLENCRTRIEEVQVRLTEIQGRESKPENWILEERLQNELKEWLLRHELIQK